MKNTITIVGFGNSITQAVTRMPEDKRWLKLLEQKLAAKFPDRKFKVINAGIGGNSAREAMARFDRDVRAHDPDYVLIEFGGNNNDPAKPERRVPPDEFKNLLEQFRHALPTKARVIVITFPPVIKEANANWKSPLFRKYLQESAARGMAIEDYVKATKAFGQKYAFPIYDLDAELRALGQRDGWQTYTLDDGVHLTERGNQVLADGVFAVLSDCLQADDK